MQDKSDVRLAEPWPHDLLDLQRLPPSAPGYTTATMPKYILPSTDWSPLLPTIVKDAQAGAIIETHTAAMYDLVL